MQKQNIKRTEEWLNDRYKILSTIKECKQANISYYEGALKAVEFLGYDWERNCKGKHTIYKRK